jgi:hypothetical protein
LAPDEMGVDSTEREDSTMAKPLGPKSFLIRNAITAHPGKTPKEIADLLNDADERMDDKIKVTPNDVSQQKQAMKKPGAQKAPAAAKKPSGNGRRKPGRKPGRKPAAAAPRASSAAAANPVELIDSTFALAQQCGGIQQLKKLVDRLAGM